MFMKGVGRSLILFFCVSLGLAACGGGGGGGSSGSATDKPTQVAPPQISTQPASVSVTEGQSANFSAVAQGDGTLTYQWQRAADANAAFQDISGATASTYAIAQTSISDAGARFRVVVTNAGGSSTSAAVTLSVTVKPASGIPTATGPYVTTMASGTSELFMTSATAIGGANISTTHVQALLADDGRALVRLGVQASASPGSTPVFSHEFIASQTAAGVWGSTEQLAADFGYGLSANAQGWVGLELLSATQAQFNASQTMAQGVGAKLLAAPNYIKVSNTNDQLPVATLGVDGTQYLSWASNRYVGGTQTAGWDYLVTPLAVDGTVGTSTTIYSEGSWDVDWPILSEGAPDVRTLVYRGRQTSAPAETSSWLRVASANVVTGAALTAQPTIATPNSFCFPIKAYTSGAITAALWGESANSGSECRLHVTTRDNRNVAMRVNDQVMTDVGEYVAQAWASLDDQGNLNVVWSSRGNSSLKQRGTQLPNPTGSSPAPIWTAMSQLKDDGNVVVTPAAIGLGDYASTALRVGPKGHIAVAYARQIDPTLAVETVVVKVYTPGVGWSAEKQVFSAPGYIQIGPDNLSVSSAGKVMVAYTAQHYCADTKLICQSDVLHLLAVVLQ
jgi:hypothetical protein